MAKLLRPKTLLLLLIFVVWLDARNTGYLIFPGTSGSFEYWRAVGQGWVHFVVTGLTIGFAAYATSQLWYPRPGWFRSVQMLLGFLTVSTVAATLHMMPRIELAREAYANGRMARGLPVDPERLDMLFQTSTMLTGIAVAIAFYALLWVLAWRRRSYVDPRFVVVDANTHMLESASQE